MILSYLLLSHHHSFSPSHPFSPLIILGHYHLSVFINLSQLQPVTINPPSNSPSVTIVLLQHLALCTLPFNIMLSQHHAMSSSPSLVIIFLHHHLSFILSTTLFTIILYSPSSFITVILWIHHFLYCHFYGHHTLSPLSSLCIVFYHHFLISGSHSVTLEFSHHHLVFPLSSPTIIIS